jgi:hypothetical protein
MHKVDTVRGAPDSGVCLTGLSEAEVRQRRGQGLGNTAPAPTGRTYRLIVVENVFTFINRRCVAPAHHSRVWRGRRCWA